MQEFISGFSYLIQGLKLLRRSELRVFVLIPLLINLFTFATLGYLAFDQLNTLITSTIELLPTWLNFLRWLLWPLATLLVLIIGFYSFSMIANIIAAPFNGLLAERTEELLRQKPLTHSSSSSDFIKDTPRMIGKEIKKVLYYLPRALLLLPLSFIPVIGPLVWFTFSAWMAAIAYMDFPLDNHKVSFKQIILHLKKRRALAFGFGSATLIGTMIPFINFLIMPAAVCGATLLAVEKELLTIEGA